ncbi:hypothetical protein JST97_21020 [bacterium]|nr:hypothetical protein [bacterium]
MEIREQLKALIEGGATPPYSLVRSDGTPLVLMDDSLVPFLLNPNPLPNNESLAELFSNADVIRVREIFYERKILLEETDSRAIQALASCLRLKSEQIGAHCMTPGEYFVEVESSGAKMLSIVTPTSIRWDERWHGDGELEDGLKLATWLAERGLPKLLEDLHHNERQAVVYQEQYEKWKSLMPCMGPLWAEFDVGVRRGQQDQFIVPALELLSQQYESHQDMLRALLGWYGSNRAGANRTYQYETFLADLLRTFPIDIYLEVLTEQEATNDEWAGAIRSFHDRAWGWRESREKARTLGKLLLERADEAGKQNLTYSIKRLKGR